ncbi:MAG TPA: Rieske 2Fe-2S domain-containing protein [Rhizomicrobium sp.]|jgi:nitrite reductase/ring-hydroxylating ferredoxin subunit|nr:Rieske 2Fe-2S domain-containing protein [Rhizomicrobium sp.]
MFTPTGVLRDELGRDGRKLLRRDGKQVLLIATGDHVFAIANRCPHEGYPLSEGTLGPGCVLTCNWHNWKFDLQSGAALAGRDPVRTYPVEMRNGEIFADLTDAPAEEQRRRALKGLEAGILDNDLSRLAREAARLERAGFDARDAIAHAFLFRNHRLEDGMTHAHAAAADWLALAARTNKQDERLAALIEPLGHIAWDTQGADEHPYGSGIAVWNARSYIAALEAEDEARATAHIRGAIADGLSYAELRPAIGEAALAHYADFGHCAIYALKTGQLIERLGGHVAEPVLLALTRMIALARREELLPEFRFYARALSEWDGTGKETPRADAYAGASVVDALRLTCASSGRAPQEIYAALLGAAAFNLLHFDVGFDRSVDNNIADNIGWLDFTHALTFANACRHICAGRPDLWPRALLQLALFVGRNRKYVRPDQQADRWHVADAAAFLAGEQHALYDHGIVEPIIACHRLKVLFALEDELAATPDTTWASAMCAAVNRYLHTPMKRHHGLRNAAQALDFVAGEG